MSAVMLFEGQKVTKLDGLDDRPVNVGGDSLLWADLDQPSEEDCGEVSAAFGLDEEGAHRLSSTASEPYFRDGGSFVHVTAYTPLVDGDALMEIECVVGESWVSPRTMGLWLCWRSSPTGPLGRVRLVSLTVRRFSPT